MIAPLATNLVHILRGDFANSRISERKIDLSKNGKRFPERRRTSVLRESYNYLAENKVSGPYITLHSV